MGINFKALPTCTFCWSVVFVFCCFSLLCSAANIITQGQFIRDGETIISAGEKFVLGFFSPGNSTYRYVGIWYYQIPEQSVVWVGNRENPISGEAGILKLENSGNLVVLDGNGSSVWSSNTSTVSNSTTGILMDTGNLILSNSDWIGDLNEAFWQSFNDQTDTYLPDMRVYMNVASGANRVFYSWKSASDPSPGQYSMGVDPRGSPQIVIWDGLNRRWRSGHWNGLIFTGVPTMRAIYLYGFKLFNEGNGNLYFTYTKSNSSDLLRFWIGWNGNEEQLWWDKERNEWSILQLQPANECEVYNKCGSFGTCFLTKSPICSCIKGFVPKDVKQWDRGDWSGGCVRRTDLQCGTNTTATGEMDGFLKIEGMKLPDFADFMEAENTNDCKEKCLKNCSCNAYAFVSGINCLIWIEDLMDIQHFDEGGNDLYIRLATSELGTKSKISKIVIVVIVVLGTFFISVSLWLLWRFRIKVKVISHSTSRWKNNLLQTIDVRSSEILASANFSGPGELGVERHQCNRSELSVFSFSDIAAATDNFSDVNKLGKGGFGTVYKGNLSDGEEIAVKRLSKTSGQGLEEFTNEIILIAKLQHRNLVRLLGYCTEGDERMLLYEYMPNKSLDSFLFDPTKQAQLDWRKRFTIIEGIARGLLYLHRDSRLRIIHRDLKASNILLDEEMNPKISDFGMAKIFETRESEASTSRVVGTYGYMAPEYAMEGLFSVKSDVYSFGVLLLEIVNGRRNRSLRSPEHSNIVGYAWDLWDCGKATELIDPTVASSCCQNEALRCIHVAMLCVQDSAFDRPTMSAVVLMLESESTTLAMPRQPTFTSTRISSGIDALKENQDVESSNDVSITLIIGR